MHRGILALALLGGVALHALNFYWFYHICRRALAKLRGREPMRAPAGAPKEDDPGRLR